MSKALSAFEQAELQEANTKLREQLAEMNTALDSVSRTLIERDDARIAAESKLKALDEQEPTVLAELNTILAQAREKAVPEPSLQKFNELGGHDELDAIEQLRFFCSLAMRGRDWLDVEQFFDAVQRQLAQAREDGRKEAVPEWTEVRDIFLPPSGRIVHAFDGKRVIRAQWIAKFSCDNISDEGDFYDYRESDDTYWLPEGWYECISHWGDYSMVFVNEKITHWMPLPAAPSPASLNAKEGVE